MNGPVRLAVEFVLPRPMAMIWRTRKMPRALHAKKPDCENLLKSLQDALTGICWRDDSQIADLAAEKWIAAGDEQPHVHVYVLEMEPRP
jgi:crossover junction endodeoxyribonuclease RusA